MRTELNTVVYENVKQTVRLLLITLPEIIMPQKIQFAAPHDLVHTIVQTFTYMKGWLGANK